MGGNVRIVFWGSERGCHATSNMLILAGYLACQKGYRITMLELAEEHCGVWNYFRGKREKYVVDFLKTLVDRQLYYVLTDEWDAYRGEWTTKVITYLEHNMDMVFINLANRTDDEARELLRNAHLVVVNIGQNLRAFDRFYARYANLSANVLLMIGNYYEDGECEREFLLKKYRITEEQLAVIPNNPEYEMACDKRCVERYLRRNRRQWRTARKNYFLKELERAAEQLCEATKKR